MSDRRVLVIGIDGGTWKVLDRAVEGGHMPFLADLLARGQRAVLRSTLPANTAAAWTAFQTGLPPVESGIYDFQRWDRQSPRGELISSGNLPKTVWEVAGEHGRRVGVLNLPLTYPPFELNGFMVSGFTTPGMEAAWTWPPELKGQLLEAVHDYRIVVKDDVNIYRPVRDLEMTLRFMGDLLEKRAAASEYLIGRFQPDLFMVHFHATDFLQHCGWYYLDPEHALYEPERGAEVLSRFYGQLDGALRRVVEAFRVAGPRPFPLLVVSDHGFQAHTRTFYLGNWLRENRLSFTGRPRRAAHWLAKWTLRALRTLDVFRLRRVLLPRRARDRAVPIARGRPGRVIYSGGMEDFARGCANEAYLFLNSGTKRLRKEAERMLKALRDLRDAETGARVVKAVHRVPADSTGRGMPDFIVEPAAGYAVNGPFRRDKPVFETVDPHEHYQVGKHAPEGIFLAVDSQTDYPAEVGIERMAGILLDELGVPAEGLGELVRRRGVMSESEQAAVRSSLEELGYA